MSSPTVKRFTRILAGLLVLVLVAYGAVLGWYYLHQDDLVYPATRGAAAPQDKGLADFQAVTIPTPDGERLSAWWKPPPAGGGVVLFLHGQSGSLGSNDYIATRSRDMAAAGLGVLALDYRGYGGSTGHPSEQGLITDARAAYDFIQAQAPAAKIALFGASLGTGVAVALAAQTPSAGVVLDSPFSSALRIAKLRYPWLPSAFLMRDRWDSAARIGAVKAPVLVMHCDADKTVPLAEGMDLYARANDPKTMVVLPGCDHIKIWNGAAKDKILETLADWVTPK